MDPTPNVYMTISRLFNLELSGRFGSSSNREYCARRVEDLEKFRYDGKLTLHLEGRCDRILLSSSRGPEGGRHLNDLAARNGRQARMVCIGIRKGTLT
jgi:hypothetical protein